MSCTNFTKADEGMLAAVQEESDGEWKLFLVVDCFLNRTSTNAHIVGYGWKEGVEFTQWLSAQSHEEAVKICFEPKVIVCKKGDGFSYLNQVAGADRFVQNPNWSEAYGEDGGFEQQLNGPDCWGPCLKIEQEFTDDYLNSNTNLFRLALSHSIPREGWTEVEHKRRKLSGQDNRKKWNAAVTAEGRTIKDDSDLSDFLKSRNPNREMKVRSRLDINGSGKTVGPTSYFTLPGEYNGFW